MKQAPTDSMIRLVAGELSRASAMLDKMADLPIKDGCDHLENIRHALSKSSVDGIYIAAIINATVNKLRSAGVPADPKAH